MKYQNDYALYAGDKLLEIGAAYQLAKKFNVKRETIKFYASPTYRRRLESKKHPTGRARIAVKIEEDIND
jgi:hypothetical protein